MTTMNRVLTLASLGCAAPALALAQSTQGEVIETIVITATKRAQILQDVPQTITAFSEKNLKDVGAADFSGILNSMAGVELKQEQSGQGGVAIRGISELNLSNLYGGTGSATGMYLDEMPLTAAGRFPGLGAFDMQRIEVLKGPQGTLFGEGSLAGTVRFIANKPKMNKWEVASDASFSKTEGGGDNHLFNVMGNIPLAQDVAALRISGYQKQDGGYLDARITDGKSIFSTIRNANSQKSDGARIALRLQPITDLVLTGTYLNYSSRNGTRNRGASPEIGSFSTAENTRDKLDAFGVTAEYSLSFADFVANASHTDRNFFINEDQGKALGAVNGGLLALGPLATKVLNVPWPNAATGINTAHDMRAKSDTLEMRLVSSGDTSLKWTGGVFYKKTATGFTDDVAVTPGIPPASWAAVTSALTKGTVSVGESLHTESFAAIKQSAIFGEVSKDFTKQFQLLAGGRAFKETRSSVSSWRSAFALISGGAAVGTIKSRDETSLFNPKVTASYKFSPDVMAYGTYSQGFRSGGQNDYQVYIPGSPADFKPERLINHEIGLKTVLLGNSLALNLSAYYMNWKDLQQIVARGSSGIGSAIGNVGDAHSSGVDLETKWLPLKGLEVNFTASVMDAVLDNAVVLPASAGGITVPKGTRVPGTSKISMSAGATYRRPLSEGLSGFFSGRIANRSDFTSELLHYQSTTPGNTTIDFRLGVEASKWQVYMFVDNASNRRIQVREDGDGPDIFSGQKNYNWGRPRTIGLNVRYAL